MRRRPMGKINKIRPFVLPNQPASCASAHLIVALFLVLTPSFLSLFTHHSFFACSFLQPDVTVGFHSSGSFSWPERGFGSYLDLKIYVYDEYEIDGLKALMYGRNGSITADDCVQGQWGHSDEDIERMIARGRQVRCLFVYADESKACSAIHGILWELQRKVRRFQQSSETFWLHNRVIVNRDMLPFPDWKTPLPLP